MRHTLFLFGEAEKGEYCTPLLCRALPQLPELLGNPPGESLGIFYAIQALLCGRELIFFRVREEGFSVPDYMRGLALLKKRSFSISALGIPGVGNPEIIEAFSSICAQHRSCLVLSEKDLYDYLTAAG